MAEPANPPIYVPFALRLDQAQHVLGAIKAVIDSCKEEGRPVLEYAPLLAAFITMVKAVDKAETES